MKDAAHKYALMMGMAGVMAGFGGMMGREVSRAFPADKHGRKSFKYPNPNGGERLFYIQALNQESADAQYAKIMKKKNKVNS